MESVSSSACALARRVMPGGVFTFRLALRCAMESAAEAQTGADPAVTAQTVKAHITLSSKPHDPLEYHVKPSSTVCAAQTAAMYSSVDIIAAVSAGVTEGECVVLSSASIAGVDIPLGEAPIKIIIGFNHTPAPEGPVFAAIDAGDIVALTRALNDDDGSTQEATKVCNLCLPITEI
jgi:hypothetical protein